MKHFPPATESMVKHRASADCPCGPERHVKYKQGSSGRGGRHQGYKTEVAFYHKEMQSA